VSAVLINAGNANCATRTGDRVAIACCDAVAKQLRVPAEQVFPASTGVIGVELDASLITNTLPELIKGLSPKKFEQAAQAILKKQHLDIYGRNWHKATVKVTPGGK